MVSHPCARKNAKDGARVMYWHSMNEAGWGLRFPTLDTMKLCQGWGTRHSGVTPKTETVGSATLCSKRSMEWRTTGIDIVRHSV